MDVTQVRDGLLQLQNDARANNLDFEAAYQHAQQWVGRIQQQTSFEPLKEGVAMTVKPLPLRAPEKDIEELMEALQRHDLDRTRQACAAALASINQLH